MFDAKQNPNNKAIFSKSTGQQWVFIFELIGGHFMVLSSSRKLWWMKKEPKSRISYIVIICLHELFTLLVGKHLTNKAHRAGCFDGCSQKWIPFTAQKHGTIPRDFLKLWWNEQGVKKKVQFALITLAKKCDWLSILSYNVPLFSAGTWYWEKNETETACVRGHLGSPRKCRFNCCVVQPTNVRFRDAIFPYWNFNA